MGPSTGVNRTYGTLTATERRLRTAQSKPLRKCCRCICCSAIIIVLVIMAFPLIIWYSFLNAGCTVQNPLCWPWTRLAPHGAPRPDLSSEEYAVGFHFAAGHGNAAIAFRNGTTIAIGRAEGDEAYASFLAHTSLPENAHPTPPYYSFGVSEDSDRQWKRWWNKRYNKPADENVAALARVLEPLRESVNQALGELGPMKYGNLVVTKLPAMYNEDLFDAAQYLGFQPVIAWSASGDGAQWPLTDVSTSYNWMHRLHNRTWNGVDGFSRHVFMVSYTEAALTAHVSIDGDTTWSSGIANFSLGHSANASWSAPTSYWFAVAEAINAALDSYHWRAELLDLVIIHGESARDEHFIQIVTEKVTAYQKNGKMPPVWSDEIVYAGAMGAARMQMNLFMRNDSWRPYWPDIRPKMQGW